MNQQTKLNIPIIISSEADYWRMIDNLKGNTVTNIQQRGRLALTHFIEADKNIKSNPNFYKQK